MVDETVRLHMLCQCMHQRYALIFLVITILKSRYLILKTKGIHSSRVMHIIETDENSSQLLLVECKNKHKYITNITCLSTNSY